MPTFRALAAIALALTVALPLDAQGRSRARRQPPIQSRNVDTAATATEPGGPTAHSSVAEPEPTRYSFASVADSLAWARAKATADRATGLRVVVSLKDFRLWTLIGEDTLMNAIVAVATGETLEYGGRRFTFTMPRGVRTVLAKESDPVWRPPDWFYFETAKQHGLDVQVLRNTYDLRDGRRLVVRDSLVGLIVGDGEWQPLPVDEHIIFNNALFIPPMGTANRRVQGALGKHRLDLGNGFLLHGTPYKNSFGTAATHGCVRLRDEDVQWLFENIPVGTKVYIY
jgi:hypothetical protein